MYLGIDFGMLGVKLVLIDDSQRLIGEVFLWLLEVECVRLGWFEQDFVFWWDVVCEMLDWLYWDYLGEFFVVEGIGFFGQMYGVIVFDGEDCLICFVILWNDMRSLVECVDLESRVFDLCNIVG